VDKVADFSAERHAHALELLGLGDEWRSKREPSHDGGRFRLPNAHNDIDVRRVITECLRLIVSPYAQDRVLAYELLHTVRFGVKLPDGMWCATTTYRDKPAADIFNRPHVWSAHDTQTQATRWLEVWKVKLARRTDYEWNVVQLDGVGASDYRHPDANPEEAIHV
jgi:hypothetical protein